MLEFLKSLGAWALTLIGITISIALILVVVNWFIKIFSEKMHWAIRTIFTILIISLLVFIAVAIAPWWVGLINTLGGLS